MSVVIPPIENGESGASVREKLNRLIQGAAEGSLGNVTQEDLDKLVDTTPPPKLLPPTITSEIKDEVCYLYFNWDVSLATDFAYYDIQVRDNGGNWISFTTANNYYSLTGVPATTYEARVRAVDKSGNKAVMSDVAVHVSAKDDIPPASPIGLECDGGFSTIWVKWTPNEEIDMSHYEIYESEFPFAPDIGDTPTFSSASNSFVRAGLTTRKEYFYWVRAADTSGNLSGWSEGKSATPLTEEDVEISTEALQGLIDATSLANGLVLIEIGDVLPTEGNKEGRQFFNTSDGKLYRFTDGVWTNEVDGADIRANSIVAGKIAAGAIGADQIAANSITAKQMVLADFSNMVPGGDTLSQADLALWTAFNSSLAHNSNAAAAYLGASSWLLTKTASGAAARIQLNDFLPVEPSQQYRLSAAVRTPDSEQAAGLYVRASWFDAARVALPAPDNYSDAVGNGAISNTYVVAGGVIAAPENAKFCKIAIHNHSTSTALRLQIGKIDMRLANAAQLIVDGSIKAQHLSTEELITVEAQIRDAIITNAKIYDLSAEKLQAGTALAKSITVAGTSLDEIREGSADPAARINKASTLIEPGKIQIDGGSTLEDWKGGGDKTKINGGAIEANSIKANSLEIGQRNVVVDGITFEHNRPAVNQVYWSSGSIRYANDAGEIVSRNISAGNAPWSSGIVYIYWVKGAITLSTTASYATAMGSDNLLLAAYEGGTKLGVDLGRTIIDGSNIKTGTIQTEQLGAGSVKADKIAVGNLAAINAQLGHILGGSFNINGRFLVYSDGTVTIQSGSSGARLVLTNTLISVFDANGTLRVRMGIW